MRISREMLRSIIRESCGDAMPEEPASLEPVVEPAPVLETSAGPIGDLMIEMEVATRALEQVVESVQNAAHLCPDCGGGVAAQAPVMEAVVAQAEALQEMLDAQHSVVTESAVLEQALTAVVEL